MTDHESLKWLKELKSPNKIFFLWTVRLNEYECDVWPKAGKQKGDAGGLSRCQVFHSFLTYEEMKSLVIKSKIPEEITKGKEPKLKKASKNFRFPGNALLIQNRKEWFFHPSPEQRPVLIKQYHERAYQSASTVTKSSKLRYF
jgi:hypothetical protein